MKYTNCAPGRGASANISIHPSPADPVCGGNPPTHRRTPCQLSRKKPPGEGSSARLLPGRASTRALEELGPPSLALAPLRHRRFDVVGRSLTSLRASAAIVISLRPLPCLPLSPALSIVTPLPLPSTWPCPRRRRVTSLFLFSLSLFVYFLSPSPVKRSFQSTVYVQVVYPGNEIWAGATEGRGGPGISVCVNFWAASQTRRGTPESPASTTLPAWPEQSSHVPTAPEAGTVGGFEAWFSSPPLPSPPSRVLWGGHARR